MAERGRLVAAPFAGHLARVLTVTLTSNDTQVVTSSDDCTIRIWDLASGDPVGEPLLGHTDWIRAATVTSDSTLIVAGDDRGAVRRWELASGHPFGDPLTGNTGRVRAIAVTSHGTQVITGGDDSTIRILELASGRLVGDPLTGHTGRVFAIALTSDDTQIITGGDDATVRIWDRAKGTPIGAPLTGHVGAVFAVAVTADGRQIVTGGADATVRIWDRASGEPMGDPLSGHILWVRALAVTSNDSRIITAAVDGTVRIWELISGRQIGDPLTGHTARVLAVAVSSDNSQIITASGDGTVRIWELTSGHQIGDPLSCDSGRVFALAVTSDDAHIITAGDNGAIRTWDRITRDPIGPSLTGHTGRVLALAVTSDDSQIVTAGVDGTIRIWDRAEGQQVDKWFTGHDGPVSALALTSDDSQIVTSSDDGTIRIWDRVGGHQVGSTLTGHTGYVFAIALTSDDSQIVTAGDDGTIRIWDRVGGHQVGSPLTGHTRRVRALAVTSDNTRIITGGEDGTIRIWDFASGRQVAGTESAMAPPILADPHSGVVSDAESATDQLGVARDVDSVAALLAARDTAPPLSVALLGDWGSGKSSFMQQVINRVDSFADASKRNPQTSAYAAEVLQVRFNAWHYSDDHLWIGLVEHLFRELADRRRDSKDDGGQRAAMEAQLASEEAKREQLTEDLTAVDRTGHDEHWFGWLTRLSRVFLVLRVASRSVWAEIGTPRRLVSGALLILAVGLTVALTVYGQVVIGWVAGVVTAAISLLSPVVLVWRRVDTIMEKVRGKLQEQKDATEKQIEELTGQLDRIDPARRLENLLVEISSPERYEQYRGIVGRIRQDLDRISEELTTAQDEWVRGKSGDAPPLQRIVLYVDDLDRCTTARVVQVLQAVNLLLGMSLFIVVVAVDPRWLLTALEDQYPKELGNDQRHERSLGFLDKIFHVAYAVRPMGNRATDYLRGLLPPVEDSESVREEDQHHSPSPQNADTQIENTTQTASITQSELVEGNSETDLGHKSPTVRRRPLTIDLSHRALRLRSAEYNFLPYLAPLLPTPRAIKKLTNLYRLLRISVPDDQLDNFLGDNKGGPYQAAALLLAVVISSPAQAGSFLAELIAAEPGPDIADTLAKLDDSALATGLAKRIKEIRKELPVHGDVATYQKWAVLVARYSFETYRLFST